MAQRIVILFFILLLAACGNGKPMGAMADAETEAVLWDVAQASEYQNSYIGMQYPALNRAAVASTLLQEILKMHRVSKSAYDKTMAYYEAHPDKLKPVIDTIIARKNREHAARPAIPPKADTALPHKDSAAIPPVRNATPPPTATAALQPQPSGSSVPAKMKNPKKKKKKKAHP